MQTVPRLSKSLSPLRAGSAGGRDPLAERQIVSFGQSTNVGWIAANLAQAEEAEVDGRAIDVWYPDPLTGPLKIETSAWDHTVTMTDADLANNKAALIGAAFAKWRTLFINIDVRPSANLDYNNATHRARIAANCGVVAKFCAEVEAATGKRVGILLDTEPYLAGSVAGADLWSYTNIYNPTAIPFDPDMRDIVRGFGEQVANAIFSNHATCNVVLTLGAHYAEKINSLAQPWGSKKYDLLPDFIDGLVDSKRNYPLAYIGDYMQGMYNEWTAAGVNFYWLAPQGWLGVTRPRNADWREHVSFDCCNLHYLFAPQKATASAASNTINLPGHLYDAGMIGGTNSEVWIPTFGDANGPGFTRNLTGVGAGTLTVDGAAFSVANGAHINSRSPLRFHSAIRAMLAACTRYVFLYANGEFGWHRATGSVVKLPPVYYRALSAARKGQSFDGL